jgi:acyl-CoA dehydrogenase
VTGAATIAFAVSEPGAGAHPKKLSATATQDGDTWRLNGEKAYVTNGPIATHLAIVAITNSGARGRKSFGAFLVPVETPGLVMRPSEHVDFLKPNGHASLDLTDVVVPNSARLGGEEDIYPLMVKPLRDHEDRVGAWSKLGAFEHLAQAIAKLPDRAPLGGGIAARLRAVATMLEQDKSDEDLLAVRAIFEDVRAQVAKADLAALDGKAQALARDLDKLGSVARYAVEAKFLIYGRRIANCA